MTPFKSKLVRTFIRPNAANNRLNRFLQELRRRSFRVFPQPGNGYFSQAGQDRFLNERIFRGGEGGTFVEIGAADGVQISNTYFFEKKLNWSGICVEPRPEAFTRLSEARKCVCLQACITDFSGWGRFLEVDRAPLLSGLVSKYDPRHLERVKNEVATAGSDPHELQVRCCTFDELMNANSMSTIDYLSIDTEGGELDLLRSIDFARFSIRAVSVENHFAEPAFEPLMKRNGYVLAAVVGEDDIYVKADFFRSS